MRTCCYPSGFFSCSMHLKSAALRSTSAMWTAISCESPDETPPCRRQVLASTICDRHAKKSYRCETQLQASLKYISKCNNKCIRNRYACPRRADTDGRSRPRSRAFALDEEWPCGRNPGVAAGPCGRNRRDRELVLFISRMLPYCSGKTGWGRSVLNVAAF